jgi:hypothetical protein
MHGKTLSNNFEFERYMNIEKAEEAVGEVTNAPASNGKESIFVSGLDPSINEAALKGSHISLSMDVPRPTNAKFHV